MATITADIDMSMSHSEKFELCEDLILNGYGPKDEWLFLGHGHPDEVIYQEALLKLAKMYSQLSSEHIELVKRLANQELF